MTPTPSPNGPLTADDLLARGPLRRLGTTVRVFESIDSTNLYLLDNPENLPDGAIVAAESQTHGRGRLGRTWEAPRGAAMLLSVLLIESAEAPAALVGVMTAIAAAEAIERACQDVRPELRWPNDLAVAGRKLGGVLVESRAIGDDRRRLVVGVGINCLQQPGHFSPEVRPKATSLEIESRAAVDRRLLAGELVARLDAHLSVARAPRDGWELWRSRSADLGARVRLREDGREIEGTVLEVDDVGDLIVQTTAGERRRFVAATTTRLWE